MTLRWVVEKNGIPMGYFQRRVWADRLAREIGGVVRELRNSEHG